MGGAVMEEQTISRAQYLDLVYSQSGTLYDLITHASCPTYDPSKPPQAHNDGIIGSIKSTPEKLSSRQSSNSTSTMKTSIKSTPMPTKTSNVNTIQTTPSKNPPPPEGKNKHKNKKKINPLEQDNQQTQDQPTADTKGKRKI